MTDQPTIRIRKVPGKWVIYALGNVYGETSEALELAEGDLPPVIYVPRRDIAMAFFDRTDRSTHCPHKGDATYFTLDTRSQLLENVAWSYEAPLPEVAAIAGHLAFDTSRVTVERH